MERNLTINVKEPDEKEKVFIDSYGRGHTAAFLDPQGVVRIGAEDGGKPIRSRSGLLVSKPEHMKPRITILKDEKITIHNLD